MGHSPDILSPQFDFDDWSKLCRTNPEQFEQLRQDTLARLLGAMSDDGRLLRLQCRIDLERHRARTSFKACLTLSTIMWNRFNDLSEVLNRREGDACEKPGMPALRSRRN